MMFFLIQYYLQRYFNERPHSINNKARQTGQTDLYKVFIPLSLWDVFFHENNAKYQFRQHMTTCTCPCFATRASHCHVSWIKLSPSFLSLPMFITTQYYWVLLLQGNQVSVFFLWQASKTENKRGSKFTKNSLLIEIKLYRSN